MNFRHCRSLEYLSVMGAEIRTVGSDTFYDLMNLKSKKLAKFGQYQIRISGFLSPGFAS